MGSVLWQHVQYMILMPTHYPANFNSTMKQLAVNNKLYSCICILSKYSVQIPTLPCLFNDVISNTQCLYIVGRQRCVSRQPHLTVRLPLLVPPYQQHTSTYTHCQRSRHHTQQGHHDRAYIPSTRPQ